MNESLYVMDGEELISHTMSIAEMQEVLSGLGYATDAAKETGQLLTNIFNFLESIEGTRNRLENVWKAVIKYCSGKCKESVVKEALEMYRRDPVPAARTAVSRVTVIDNSINEE